MSGPGTVCAVIPNWNRAGLLGAVLADLGRQTYPLAEVVVVDNGSTDDSAAVADGAGARVIRLDRNEGFARAVNRGIQASNSEWVLVLNNDVTMGGDWLATLMEAARAANAWFATGKLLQAGRPELLDGAYDAVSRGGMAWRCGSGRPDGPLWSQPKEIAFPSLTATLIRRELFERVGGLDESFGSYLEDVDFALRCAAGRYAGVYVPGAVARHEGSATLGAWHNATVRLMARNQILLVKKHFHGAPWWPIVAGQLLWGILALRQRAGYAWIRGKLDGLRWQAPAPPGEWSRIQNIVECSEADIRDLQTRTGFDLYWKLYFALVRN